MASSSCCLYPFGAWYSRMMCMISTGNRVKGSEHKDPDIARIAAAEAALPGVAARAAGFVMEEWLSVCLDIDCTLTDTEGAKVCW